MNIYIWKGKKIQIGNDFAQEEFNLLEASKEQLEGCLKHCDTMLNNTDKYQPGRYVLCDLIKEQIVKCNVAIYIKEKSKTEPVMSIVNALRGANPECKLSDFMEVDEQYKDLKVSDVIDGALDKLGLFIRKHITLTSLTFKRGIRISNEDYASKFTGFTKDQMIDYYRSYLNIPNDIKIRLSPTGFLADDIKQIMDVRNSKYSDLTKIQLTILRDKILPDLLQEVHKHISFWEVKSDIIKYIMKDKGFIK